MHNGRADLLFPRPTADKGITGYVVDSVDDAFLKMVSLHALDRGREGCYYGS
jgi:hypothetical protein